MIRGGVMRILNTTGFFSSTLSHVGKCFVIATAFGFLAANTPVKAQNQNASPPPKGETSYDQISPVLLGKQTFEDMRTKDKAAKAGIMERQKTLLEERYNLASKPHANAKMSRG